MAEPAVRVENLRKVFAPRNALGAGPRRETVAVDDVSFSVAPGGSLGIVGESGSGKTTTVRILMGLEHASSGRLFLGGTDWAAVRSTARARRARARQAQMVFQNPYLSLDPRQSVRECLSEVLRLHTDLGRAARHDRIMDLLDSVGLGSREAEARPGALSGGQRQRVAIARALAADPTVLILDEAVAALDVSIQAQVINLLNDIRTRSGTTFVFVSHDLAVVRQLCEDTVVMHRGRIVERGPTADVIDSPQQPYTRALIDAVPGVASVHGLRRSDRAHPAPPAL